MKSPWDDIGAALNKIPFVVWGAVFLLIAFIAVFMWNEATFKRHMPMLRRHEILTALANVHQKQGGYPETVETLLQFSAGLKEKAGRPNDNTFSSDNYMYQYHRLDKDNAVLWAFPKGRLRLKAKTYLFICRSGKISVWRGNTVESIIDEEKIAKINKPTFELLERIGMEEVKRLTGEEILEAKKR